jgi:hypothetical protein
MEEKGELKVKKESDSISPLSYTSGKSGSLAALISPGRHFPA